jgi:predicted outer membrane lipoprotein
MRPEPMRVPLRSWLLRLLMACGAAAVLTLVYLEYLNPHVIVDIATRFWSCF